MAGFQRFTTPAREGCSKLQSQSVMGPAARPCEGKRYKL